MKKSKEIAIKKTYLVFYICIISTSVFSQTVNVTARLIDYNTKRYVNQGIVVNKSSNFGFFVELDGTFSTKLNLNDTILISSSGYAIARVCFKDSVATPSKIFTITLHKQEVNLKTLEIKPQKSLVEIQNALKKIKTPEADKLKRYEGVLGAMSAVESPITYMYMQFSRMERSKRLVEELTNEDNRMELQRELMRSYLFNDIVNLNESQLDDFIRYCRLSDDFIRRSTEYELAVYVKKRYLEYVSQNDYARPGQ